MARKRQISAALNNEAICEAMTAEPLPIEDLEDATVEDYKKLNEKVDEVMSKIKGRKERRRKK